MYLYTGTHLESVDGHELMVFLKEAYRRLSGDDMASGKKELVNGLSSQFPYTVMGLNIKQADEKINFRNGTLDLKSGMLCKHNWRITSDMYCLMIMIKMQHTPCLLGI